MDSSHIDKTAYAAASLRDFPINRKLPQPKYSTNTNGGQPALTATRGKHA
jgi:hypothetical protein